MKYAQTLAILSLSLFALSAHAEPRPGKVSCTGKNGAKEIATLNVEVSDAGVPSGHIYYLNLENGSQPWENDLEAFQLEEAATGNLRASLVFNFHNTTIKLSADSDFFGLVNPAQADDSSAPYQGKLIIKFGSKHGEEGDGGISRFDVVCRAML
jgi:hypothetical protein